MAQDSNLAAFHVGEALRAMEISVEGDTEETPARWVKALREMTSGYQQKPSEILSKRFYVPTADELVILKDIPFTSLCEHHVLPFSGVAHVAYLPGSFVVGLSKLARLVDCFANRLQVQERLTQEIAKALQSEIKAEAVGVVVEASHSCMACRGIKKPGAKMITSSLLGLLRTSFELRAEFMSLIR